MKINLKIKHEFKFFIGKRQNTYIHRYLFIYICYKITIKVMCLNSTVNKYTLSQDKVKNSQELKRWRTYTYIYIYSKI